MYRAACSFFALLLVLVAPHAHAVAILPGEIEDFGTPCTLSLSQNGSIRTLSWNSVAGAATYKVGYRIGGTIVTLAGVTGNSYDHVGWSVSDCMEYLLVACDSTGAKMCAAHIANVGNCLE